MIPNPLSLVNMEIECMDSLVNYKICKKRSQLEDYYTGTLSHIKL